MQDLGLGQAAFQRQRDARGQRDIARRRRRNLMMLMARLAFFVGLPTMGFHLESAFRQGRYGEAAAFLLLVTALGVDYAILMREAVGGAAVSLLGTLKVSAGASLIVPLIVLALPVVDTTQVVIGRLARGIRNPLGHPDKTHIHHRVLARTASARRTAVILWVVALTCGALGMLLQGVKLPAILSTVVVVAAWVEGAAAVVDVVDVAAPSVATGSSSVLVRISTARSRSRSAGM